MNPKIESPAEVHADHRHWKSEIAMWQDDIEQWRKQQQVAIAQLEQVTKSIRDQEKVIEDHLDSVEKIQASIEYHERNLAQELKGSHDDIDDVLLERHSEEASLLSKQRETHERIKKLHHVAMANVATLAAVLKAAI